MGNPCLARAPLARPPWPMLRAQVLSFVGWPLLERTHFSCLHPPLASPLVHPKLTALSFAHTLIFCKCSSFSNRLAHTFPQSPLSSHSLYLFLPLRILSSCLSLVVYPPPDPELILSHCSRLREQAPLIFALHQSLVSFYFARRQKQPKLQSLPPFLGNNRINSPLPSRPLFSHRKGSCIRPFFDSDSFEELRDSIRFFSSKYSLA